MWLKSDRWGTVNWGQLSQATDNVALLPDLSGTIIESNAVLFDGGGMFVRPKGAKNSNDLATGDFVWAQVVNCLVNGGGLGADCNGYPNNGFRYDTPTWWGFSASGGYYEDDAWDIALKYAADWNSIKVSAAVGFTQITDEGCLGGEAMPTAPATRLRAAAAFRSRASGLMAISSKLARPSCMCPVACSFTACISAKRTMGRSFGRSTSDRIRLSAVISTSLQRPAATPMRPTFGT